MEHSTLARYSISLVEHDAAASSGADPNEMLRRLLRVEIGQTSQAASVRAA